VVDGGSSDGCRCCSGRAQPPASVAAASSSAAAARHAGPAFRVVLPFGTDRDPTISR
jgi:hypothetical protein